MTTLLEQLTVSFPKRGEADTYEDTLPSNTSWANTSFLTGRKHLPKEVSAWLYWGSADLKASNTSWGGNFAINPRPQWTPSSDCRHRGTYAYTKTKNDREIFKNIRQTGMGRMYSEQQDDNTQRIYLRFGVPQFNALTTYINNMTSTELTALATTGKSKGIIYRIFQIVGTIFIFVRQPLIASLVMLGKVMSSVSQAMFWQGGYAFYSLKPTQHQYWGMVQSLMNEFLVRSELIDRSVSKVLDDSEERDESTPNTNDRAAIRTMAPRWRLNQQTLDELHAAMPEVFTKDLGLDVVALATRHIRRQRKIVEEQTTLYVDGQEEAFLSFLEKEASHINTYNQPSGTAGSIGTATVPEDEVIGPLAKLWTAAALTNYYTPQGLATTASQVLSATIDSIVEGISTVFGEDDLTTAADFRDNSDTATTLLDATDPNAPVLNNKRKEELSAKNPGLMDYFKVEFDMAMEFLALDVAYTGAIEESFTNSVKPSELGGMLGGISSASRTVRFNLANGNIVGGAAGTVLNTLVGSVTEAVQGGISGLTLGMSDSLFNILRGATPDIPKYWESSEVNLPAATYRIELRASAGNLMSQIKGIYLPLFCILAGALPQTTGSASHANPLYCQLFDRGRQQKNLAMITGVSIRRGVGNTGFDGNGRTLAVDVDIDITDLTPIIAAPSSTAMIDANSPIGHYIGGLAAQTIESQIYGRPRMLMNLNRLARDVGTMKSPAFRMNQIAQTMKGAWLDFRILPSYSFGLYEENTGRLPINQ